MVRPKKKPAKKRTTKKKTGRPPKEIDPKDVESLASDGCSGDEIAIHLGVARSLIYRRFGTAIEKGHTGQKVSLRRKQFELAMAGDRTMLVWLGKQYLGQTDKREIENTGNPPTAVDHKAIARELLEAKDYATFQRSRALAEDTHASPVGTNGKSGPVANGTPPSNGRRGTNGSSGPNGSSG